MSTLMLGLPAWLLRQPVRPSQGPRMQLARSLFGCWTRPTLLALAN
jgi:hypothetical protein